MGAPIDSLFGASTPQVPDIDLGMYDALLVGVSTTYLEGGQYGEGFTVKDENDNTVNRFRWLWSLVDDEGAAIYELDDEGEPVSGDPIEVDCITGLQFFAKAKNPSKQTRIMKALMTPAEFTAWADGEQAPTMADLLQRKVQVEIGENAKGYPTVVNVIAPKARRAKRGTRPAATDEADAE